MGRARLALPLVLFFLSACEGLIGADFNRQASDADGGGSNPSNAGGSDGGTSGSDGAISKVDGGGGTSTDGSIVSLDGGTYDDAQKTLQALRFPGPTTQQGSKGYCTKSTLVIKDNDGSLHSWSASTKMLSDYGFKAKTTVDFFPSDAFIAVDNTDYSNIFVYDATMANAQVGTLPYAYNSAGTDDGALLIQQTGTIPNQTTTVRHWIASSNTTEDIGTPLPTPQPPDSFGQDELVVSASVNVPYPIYILNVKTKATTSVTLDGATSKYDTLSTPAGLVVSYARNGPPAAIRLYKGNDDKNRLEIGDEIANEPPLFSGSSAMEHTFIAHITLDGKNLLYGSPFGIWAYGLDTGALHAVQLGPNMQAFVPDVMCVIASARLLVYRMQSDSVGQIWAVPLASILP